MDDNSVLPSRSIRDVHVAATNAASRPHKLLCACVLLALLSGCVERRMTIRTNVDNQGGALVYLDNEEVGISPVSTAFTYYADREIKLVKDGYETVTLVQPVRAPWWDSLLVE